jgi:hypothetical protein
VSDGKPGIDRAELQLQAAGLTLLGVILSIGVTVGMGLSGAWWLRVGLGAAVCVVLAVVVAFGARHTPVLSRLARWITGQ